MMISLPTGSKIFNWLCTYLGTHASSAYIYSSSILFVLIFLLTFTIGGSTGVILGNVIVDISLHDTYYVVTHFHIVLSLGAVISIFSSLMFYQDQLLPSQSIITSSTSSISKYHLFIQFVGILFTFTPMHFLGFNVMPRRVPDFPDILNSWNYISSLGSGLTLISFFILVVYRKTRSYRCLSPSPYPSIRCSHSIIIRIGPREGDRDLPQYLLTSMLGRFLYLVL